MLGCDNECSGMIGWIETEASKVHRGVASRKNAWRNVFRHSSSRANAGRKKRTSMLPDFGKLSARKSSELA